MPTIENLFSQIRELSPSEIEAKIVEHKKQIAALRRILLLIGETTHDDHATTA